MTCPPHHWILPSLGVFGTGVCKRCGERREYNLLPIDTRADYRTNFAIQPPKQESGVLAFKSRRRR